MYLQKSDGTMNTTTTTVPLVEKNDVDVDCSDFIGMCGLQRYNGQ
jgi:hypothetical protein